MNGSISSKRVSHLNVKDEFVVFNSCGNPWHEKINRNEDIEVKTDVEDHSDESRAIQWISQDRVFTRSEQKYHPFKKKFLKNGNFENISVNTVLKLHVQHAFLV